MRFGLSEQQVQLQDMLGRFLKDAAGPDRVRTFAGSGDKRAVDLVRGLSDLGVTGIVTREEGGGARACAPRLRPIAAHRAAAD